MNGAKKNNEEEGTTIREFVKREIKAMTNIRLTFLIIDCILLIALLTTVTYVQIQGKYTDTRVITIETCQGLPTPQAQQTLQQNNIQTEEITRWANNR